MEKLMVPLAFDLMKGYQNVNEKRTPVNPLA